MAQAPPGGGTRPADGNVRTDDQGRYVFDGLCPGEYFVQPVFDRDTLTIDVSGGEVFHWSRPVTLRLPPFLRGAANFTLAPLTEEITVRVFHPSNLGIPDVRVVVGPVGRDQPAPTDANGVSVIRGLPCCSQTYAVAVSHPDLSIDTPFRRVRRYCQVDENSDDRPTRYCVRLQSRARHMGMSHRLLKI